MGESSAGSGQSTNGTALLGAATAQHDQHRATQTHSDARLRYWSSVGCDDHDRPRPQGTAAHPAGRSDSESQASRRRTHLTLGWRGGAFTTLDVPAPRFKPMGPRMDEDTISPLRRLAHFIRMMSSLVSSMPGTQDPVESIWARCSPGICTFMMATVKVYTGGGPL
jgi:hypothetical protein